MASNILLGNIPIIVFAQLGNSFASYTAVPIAIPIPGLKMLDKINPITTAQAVVAKKIITVNPPIFPTFFKSEILDIPKVNEVNTRGIIIIFIKFTYILPNGSNIAADSGCP